MRSAIVLIPDRPRSRPSYALVIAELQTLASTHLSPAPSQTKTSANLATMSIAIEEPTASSMQNFMRPPMARLLNKPTRPRTATSATMLIKIAPQRHKTLNAQLATTKCHRTTHGRHHVNTFTAPIVLGSFSGSAWTMRSSTRLDAASRSCPGTTCNTSFRGN